MVQDEEDGHESMSAHLDCDSVLFVTFIYKYHMTSELLTEIELSCKSSPQVCCKNDDNCAHEPVIFWTK